MRSSHVTSWRTEFQTQCRRVQRSWGRQNSEDPEWLEWNRMGEERGNDVREATAVESAWRREVLEDLESKNEMMSTRYCKDAAATWVGANKLVSMNNYVSVHLEWIRYRNYQKTLQLDASIFKYCNGAKVQDLSQVGIHQWLSTEQGTKFGHFLN